MNILESNRNIIIIEKMVSVLLKMELKAYKYFEATHYTTLNSIEPLHSDCRVYVESRNLDTVVLKYRSIEID